MSPSTPALHPVVAQMSPSPEQRPAILTRGCDVIVTAGAGTGKTRTLVARYLSLLADGIPLRSILAITFTLKAAREMRNRVREEIRRLLQRENLAASEQELWQTHYRQLDAARIGTIHGLCGEILRAHPAEARVDPRFDVLEEGRATILLGHAVEEALAWAADNPAVVPLFQLLGERSLRTTLDRLMARRLDTAEALAALPDNLRDHWQSLLRAGQRSTLASLLADPMWQGAVDVLRENEASDASDKAEQLRLAVLAAIDAPHASLEEQLSALGCIDAIKLTVGSQKKWPGGKSQVTLVKDAFRCLRTMWRDNADVLGLAFNLLDKRLAEATPLLGQLFDFASARYQALKDQHNGLDFDDLEQRAVQLLKDDVAVRHRWQQDISAILVDEFQDTNGRQRDLVNLINAGANEFLVGVGRLPAPGSQSAVSDGELFVGDQQPASGRLFVGGEGKLFAVGDAKQSIYRFRGADVTVFREERQRIQTQGGAHFPLATSYRAHQQLIAALNVLLRPVLGDRPDPSRPWLEPFAPLEHHRHEPGDGFKPPYVELHLTEGTSANNSLIRAAQAIVSRIGQLVAGGEHSVSESGVSRPLHYGDIAILCRATRSFAPYEDALEAAGIPFLTVSGRGFYGRPEIRDLLNALQAIDDPTDDLALAGLLRSPAMALSDEALFRLRRRQRRDRVTSLYQELFEADDLLDEPHASRAQRASLIIQELHDQAGRRSVADQLKAFIDSTDYRAALLQSGQSRAERNVSKLLSDAQSSGIVSVGEFLEYVQGLRDTGAREGEARAASEGVVQIMTVHAAKGLEFPVVVIGDVGHRQPKTRGTIVDPELGILLPLQDNDGDDEERPAIYQLGKALADDREAAETHRLLYVAATRARELLLINGCFKLNSKGQIGSLGGWLGDIGGESGLGLQGRAMDLDRDGNATHRMDLGVGSTKVACTVYEPLWISAVGRLSPVPKPAPEVSSPVQLPPPLLEPVQWKAESIDEDTLEREREPQRQVWRVVPESERATAPAWVVGRLVHESLSVWRFPEDEDFDAWLQARARALGIADSEQLRQAGRATKRLLRRFQAHPFYTEMREADRRLHEVEYSIIVDGEADNGAIDVMYLRGDQWTVVEIKTDRVRKGRTPQDLEKYPKYEEQARRYGKAFRRLLDQEPEVHLCFLNAGEDAQAVQIEDF